MSSKCNVVAIGLASVWLLILMLANETNASSMLYKKNGHDTYEPDLVAVSSTVIPLTEYQASAGLIAAGDSAKYYSEEYKQAYLRHLQQKQKQRLKSYVTSGAETGADRLITG